MAFLSKRAKKFWIFVSVTAAAAVLLVVVFFGAVGWFFGRSPAREFETLKRNVDVQLVQSWAVQTLQQFPNPPMASLLLRRSPVTLDDWCSRILRPF
jgi:hypothetical protein